MSSMFDDLSWMVFLIAILIVVFVALEIWVIILISGFLATWFGLNGVLWWVCAFMMFVLINGLLGAVWNMK